MGFSYFFMTRDYNKDRHHVLFSFFVNLSFDSIRSLTLLPLESPGGSLKRTVFRL